MKRLFSTLIFTFVLVCSQGQIITEVSVIPKPAVVKLTSDHVTLPDYITIMAKTADENNIAHMLQDFLKEKSIHSDINIKNQSDVVIRLVTMDTSAIVNEGYKLSINKKEVVLSASSGAGLFYGLQTLLQLLSASDNKSLPIGELEDHPRFSWRGLHLDVGRHFFPVSFIKRYIDLMSHFKYNTFHWHLTEDQGWRIEIKKYPKLQEVAAYRKETVVGHASTRTRNEAKYDGKPHGGYYTQDEVKDVVAYAAQRYITVVPEIEMPGHAQAALAAYPYLGCTGGPYEVATTWGVFKDVFCAGKETTFQFLQDVMDEVIPLFPGKYIHIGGDECPKDNWRACPHCQQRIKNENLKDAHELQSYFIQRMEKYINAKGKQIIGWDEILEGGLAPNAAVMSWRGEEGGIAAAQQNHLVVMTPVKWCYFDYYQAPPENEPLAIGGYLPVSQVYNYEPVPSGMTSTLSRYIMGSQGNVWTEYMTTPEHVEYMVYPRAVALAEVLWSPKEGKNYENFVERLKANQNLLDFWKINYARHVFTTSSK